MCDFWIYTSEKSHNKINVSCIFQFSKYVDIDIFHQRYTQVEINCMAFLVLRE